MEERTHTYTDETGNPLYRVVIQKHDDGKKDAKQYRYENGRFISGMNGVALVPYNLPALNIARYAAEQGEAMQVFITEGEKDCDTLAAHGRTATTNPMGAGNWRDDLSPYLTGLHVVILPDNDEAGHKHADKVAASVADYAASVKIVRLWEIMPDLPPKGDVTDFLERGGTMKQIDDAAARAGNDGEPEQTTALPFPVGAFPRSIALLLRTYEAETEAPAEFLGAAILSVAGALIGKCIELKFGNRRATGTTWIALVAPSGAGKTEPINLALKPLRETDKEHYRQYQRDKAEHEKQVRATKTSKSGQPPPPAMPPQYVLNDITLEALHRIAAIAQRGFIIHRDELLSWLKSFNQYRGKSGGDGEAWLSLWSDEGVSVGRKSDGLLRIDDPRISVIGGLQTGLLPRLAEGDNLTNGFFARLLFVIPAEVKPPKLTTVATDFSAWNTIVGNLQHTIKPQRNFDDTPAALTAEYTPEAWAIITRYDDELSAEISETQDDNEPLAAALGKLRTYLHRFALIIQALRYGANETHTVTQIEPETAASAVAISRYFHSTTAAALTVLYKKAAEATTRRRVTRLREQGKTYKAIAEIIGISEWNVRKLLGLTRTNSHDRR
ncbi:MAG: DUF3987 domain-containing protein [Bacteroidetes bacterium]|nr:DUF3987 domain-containing protein [Bacteroidota bacterium]